MAQIEDSADWNRWRGAIDTRMSSIESQMARASTTLQDIQRLRWKAAGAVAALGFSGGILAQLFIRWVM